VVVAVYPELILSEAIVPPNPASTVEVVLEVELKMTASPLTGTVSSDQLVAVDQLVSSTPAPPSQVLVAAEASEGRIRSVRDNSRVRRMTNLLLIEEIDEFICIYSNIELYRLIRGFWG